MTAEREGNRLACPNCLSPDHLFENVSGWREIGGIRMVDGRCIVERPFGRVEDPEHNSYGCSNGRCNVEDEIQARRLVQIDRGGNPIVVQPPEQGTLA